MNNCRSSSTQCYAKIVLKMSDLPSSCPVPFAWLFVVILTLAPPINGTDPTYSPQTLSDASGNSADNSSTITWASLPAGEPFEASSPSRVSEGLKAYYDLMHSFINSVFMKGIPDEIIENGIKGDFDSIVGSYQSYITYFIGFGICVVIGVLFLLIFPIVACCFCCCRLCGNCGGKSQQLQKNADNTCRKYTFATILFVSTVFIMVGTICIYINNENMTTTLNNIPDTAENNLNDVRTFVNNTVNEAKHIVTNNFDFVKSAFFRDLDNIAYLVGLPLKTDIEDNTNISNVLASAYALANSLDTADAALTAVESNKTAMETAVTELETALNAVSTNLDDIFTACGTTNCPNGGRPDYSGASLDIDTSAFPDLTSARTSMDDAKGTNLTEQIVNAEAELEDIPDRVSRDSNTTREDIKTTMSDVSDDLEEIVDQITDVNNQISGENATIDLDRLIEDIKDYKELLETYDKYRWYGGVGLASIGMLVIVFATFGLLFGVFGTSTSTPPDERGCISNCGGIMLMVSASLILIFSAFLMLLTFLTFIPGAPIHKVFCEPVTDLEELERYLTIYNDQQVGAGKYFLADIVLSNDTIPLTVTSALQDCKAGQGAFTAFKLEEKFDLTDMLNYSKTIDVQAEIDAVNINFSSVEIYSSSLQTQLSDLKDAVDINFSDFYNELGSDITQTDLGTIADDIDTYASSISDPTAKPALQAQATELRSIEAEEVAYVTSNKTALNTSVAEMDAAVSSIPTLVDNLDSGLKVADNYIQNNGSTVVRSILNTYVDRLLGIVDSFVDFTDDAVKNQLGSCEPIWNIYNSLLVYTFCYNFMDCFNGFWFSLGWVIFFFMPSLIFSVKLAKYFRRMDYPDDESLLSSESPPPYSANGEKNPNSGLGQGTESPDMPSKAKFWMKNNKVSHRDSVDDCTSSSAPPFPSKESRDYLEQVPPNLYVDSSYTVDNNTGSTSQPVTVNPTTSNGINPALDHQDSSSAHNVFNDSKSPVVNDNCNEDTHAQEEETTFTATSTEYHENTVSSSLEKEETKSSALSASGDLEKATSLSSVDYREGLNTSNSGSTEGDIISRNESPPESNLENDLATRPDINKKSHVVFVENKMNSISDKSEEQNDYVPAPDKECSDIKADEKNEKTVPEDTLKHVDTGKETVLPPSPEDTLKHVDTGEETVLPPSPEDTLKHVDTGEETVLPPSPEDTLKHVDTGEEKLKGSIAISIEQSPLTPID